MELPPEEHKTIDAEVPYDKEKYKDLFSRAQKEYPNVDWIILHAAVVSELMGIEPDENYVPRKYEET